MALTTSRANAPDINVTPLIDVLLVLLIICMVITPLTPKGLEAAVPAPKTDQTSTEPEDPVVLRLVQAGPGSDQPDIRINQQAVSWDELKTRLTGIYQRRSNRVLFVQGDRSVDFLHVAAVMDQARQSGVERVGLLSEKIR